MKYVTYFLIICTFVFAGCYLKIERAVQTKNYDSNKIIVKSYNFNEQKKTTTGNNMVEISELIYKKTTEIVYECIQEFKDNHHLYYKGEIFKIYGKQDNDIAIVNNDEVFKGTLSTLIIISKNGYVTQGYCDFVGMKSLYQPDWPSNQMFEKKDLIIHDTLKGDFQYELLYSGITGNNLKLFYREYSKDMARPAFNQELNYNLDESKIIAFKKFEIEIIKATNSFIEYKVLKDGL